MRICAAVCGLMYISALSAGDRHHGWRTAPYKSSSHEVSCPCLDKCGKRGSGRSVRYLICALLPACHVSGVTSTIAYAVSGGRCRTVSFSSAGWEWEIVERLEPSDMLDTWYLTFCSKAHICLLSHYFRRQQLWIKYFKWHTRWFESKIEW